MPSRGGSQADELYGHRIEPGRGVPAENRGRGFRGPVKGLPSTVSVRDLELSGSPPNTSGRSPDSEEPIPDYECQPEDGQ